MDPLLLRIVECLSASRIRATYDAVARRIGVAPISIGARLGGRRPQVSWIVNTQTGLPTGYTEAEMHPELRSNPRIIKTREELEELLSDWDSRQGVTDSADSSTIDSPTDAGVFLSIDPGQDDAVRWRDQAVVPDDYENLAALVRAARRARSRFVEFDWRFSLEELRSLRAAVHEWGSGSVGSYKCFDARILDAINSALGETDSVLFLNEPRNSAGRNCAVACEQDGDFYRLKGHATFDIVFGYGMGGVLQTPGLQLRLSPSVRGKLASPVSMLGWDLNRLAEARFRGVLNAMYGNRLDYGVQDLAVSLEPAIDVAVHFQGPFSALPN